jgi:hypothetical protein
MSYILPSPLIYQQLANAGGVANISPDLNAVIVGPCYNLVDYDGSSAASLTLSAALDASGNAGVITNNQVNNTFTLPGQKPGQVIDPTSLAVYLNSATVETLVSGFTSTTASSELNIIYPSGTGASTSGSSIITGVANANTKFFIGDLVTVTGIGVDGSTVSTSVTSVTSNSVTVAASANATVASVSITKLAPAYSPAIAASSSAVLSGVTNAALFVPGDNVTVTGAGAAGADLVANIVGISGTNVTLDTVVGTSNPTALLSKNAVNNLNSVSSTNRVEDGDSVVVYYLTPGGLHRSFTSTVASFVATNNVLSSIILSDMLPADAAGGLVEVHVRKVYNNQLLAATEYDSTATAATGEFTILPTPNVVYGLVISGEVHAQYRALRTDLSGAIQTITVGGDVKGILGTVDERNPLALGVTLAMANTTTQVLALAVPSNDLLGYETALQMLEGAKVYSMVPLTTELDIITAFQKQAEQLSTPQMAAWRIALVSTSIPTVKDIGPYNENLVNANSGNSAITLVNGRYILTVSNATFLSDGVVPGDIVKITAGTGTPSPVGSHQVKQVLSNQQLEIVATGTATGVSYYVTRNLTKAQQADYVAANSTAFGSGRVVHCPNTAGVILNGVTKYLPGYYFMAGVAGLIAGLPSQSGLTNIALAGFADVQYSNFYFTRAQMDTMAAAGTFLMVQEAQGSIPYVRHELTTDMSVLQYREIQQVKNWDYISYFFHDILKSFIGKWNITPDSLQTLRQSITSGGKMLQGRKLPKVGAPLTDFSIKTLAQDTNNLDNVICEMPIKMPTVMNYVSLYLIV